MQQHLPCRYMTRRQSSPRSGYPEVHLLTTTQLAPEPGYMNRSREVFIRMSLLALMAVTCFLILKPFLLLVLWSIILAIAIYPAYRRLTRLLHGRERWAAIICTVLLLAMVIVPALLLAGTLTGA